MGIMRPTESISVLVIVTIVLVIVFFIVLTYLSWGTTVGISLRYYYYLTALITLSVVIGVLSVIISESSRRASEEKARLLHREATNQNYWINLERTFMEYNKDLIRLYKQMWPGIPEIQAIPDPLQITPEMRMQEIHASNLLLGVIHNLSDSVTFQKKPQEVLDTWRQPEYRGFYSALSSWMKSDIIYQRWSRKAIIIMSHIWKF